MRKEFLVIERLAVDALPTRSVAELIVAALRHEALDDTVEFAALKTWACLTGAQRPEILGSTRHKVVIKLKRDSSDCLATNADVEEHLGVGWIAGGNRDLRGAQLFVQFLQQLVLLARVFLDGVFHFF